MSKKNCLGSGADLLQRQLFADCATTCEAYHFCGGNRRTAPCGCAYATASPLYRQCQGCEYSCRERTAQSIGDGFAAQVAAGLTLEEVRLSQPVTESLPVFIPLHTHNVRIPDIVLPFKWIATDAQSLLNARELKPAVLDPKFATAESTREHLRVSPSCQLLAVFNSPDWVLDSFWSMPRQALFRHLQRAGFYGATGPTFSVINRTAEDTMVPHAHHITMLMHHHRVIAEQQAAGLAAIPNLYWPDDDATQFRQLAAWLRDNPHIHTVSRDFSMRNGPLSIEKKTDSIIRLLNEAGRSFRVLIIGTGPANAPRIIRQLAEAQHTCSIISSAPIIAATRNDEYTFNEAGKMLQKPSDKSGKHPHLMVNNLLKFNKLLEDVARQYA